ncbi:MAG TPA: TIGR00730 family Rossman fold protein [Acidobacteriota bacterium]|nr:TIGR00730 family Rossman fold protein [Acidobacteriota bacterium]
MKRICVFCGSSLGNRKEYADAARRFGQVMVQMAVDLVYGGGSIGLMGVLADAILSEGGQVFGVIPERLATKELAHTGLTRLYVVTSMHERKAVMAELAHGFAALPGGLGTFEELFEVVTWAQLGIHRKPIGLLNTAGYFDPLIAMIEAAIDEGFIQAEHRELLVVEEDSEALLGRLLRHRPPAVPKIIGSAEA